MSGFRTHGAIFGILFSIIGWVGMTTGPEYRYMVLYGVALFLLSRLSGNSRFLSFILILNVAVVAILFLWILAAVVTKRIS